MVLLLMQLNFHTDLAKKIGDMSCCCCWSFSFILKVKIKKRKIRTCCWGHPLHSCQREQEHFQGAAYSVVRQRDVDSSHGDSVWDDSGWGGNYKVSCSCCNSIGWNAVARGNCGTPSDQDVTHGAILSPDSD